MRDIHTSGVESSRLVGLVFLLLSCACGNEIDDQLADAEAAVKDARRELTEAEEELARVDDLRRAEFNRDPTRYSAGIKTLPHGEEHAAARKRRFKAQAALKRAERRLEDLRRLFPE